MNSARITLIALLHTKITADLSQKMFASTMNTKPVKSCKKSSEVLKHVHVLKVGNHKNHSLDGQVNQNHQSSQSKNWFPASYTA